MLVEYQGKVFNAEEEDKNVVIWRYVPTDGCEKRVTGRGITYYEKTINNEEVKEFFSVVFIATINKRRYVIQDYQLGKVDILCDEATYSKTHGFMEIERGVWMKTVDIKVIEQFKFIKTDEDSPNKKELILSEKEFIRAWNEYVVEVNI